MDKSLEKKNSLKDYELLEEYLYNGGKITKDCWISPMHVSYDKMTDKFNLVTIGHTYNGARGLTRLEDYSSVKDIPYAGTWIPYKEEETTIPWPFDTEVKE